MFTFFYFRCSLFWAELVKFSKVASWDPKQILLIWSHCRLGNHENIFTRNGHVAAGAKKLRIRNFQLGNAWKQIFLQYCLCGRSDNYFPSKYTDICVTLTFLFLLSAVLPGNFFLWARFTSSADWMEKPLISQEGSNFPFLSGQKQWPMRAHTKTDCRCSENDLRWTSPF